MKILVTGSAGFIAGYPRPGFARPRPRGSLDWTTSPNMAKWPRATRAIPATTFIRGDAKDTKLLTELAWPVATTSSFCAAKIGGITYFHEYAYDLIAENERITAAQLRRGRHGFPPSAAPKSGPY